MSNSIQEGIKITGPEMGFRLCISECYYHHENYEKSNIIESLHSKSSFDKTEYDKISSILYKVLSKYNIRLSHDTFYNLIFHIIVAKNRWIFYNYISHDYNNYQDVKDTKFLEAGHYLTSLIEEEFSIILPFEESVYFALHLMTKRIYDNEDGKSTKDNEYIKILVNGFITQIKNDFNIDLSSDEDLIRSLNLHFPVMLSRLKFGFTIRNPRVFEYSRKYTFAHIIVSKSGRFLENELNINLSVYEKTYIMLYINLALLRLKQEKKRKYLLINRGSRSETLSIYYELLQLCDLSSDSLDLMDFSNKFETTMINKYDCVLTSIPNLPISSIPVIYFDETTMDRNYFRNEFLNIEEKEINLADVFSKDTFYSISPLDSKELFTILKKNSINNIEPIGNNIAISSKITNEKSTKSKIFILDREIKVDSQTIQMIAHFDISKQSFWTNEVLFNKISIFFSSKNRVSLFIKAPLSDTYIDYL